MFLSLLFSSPILALAWLVAILCSLTVHEFSHGLVAKWLGDSTAEREGRLSLNPLAHIDWMGMIPLLLFGFGWATPVPYNPYNLANPKRGAVLIALAGPLSNFALATVCGVIFRVLVVDGAFALENVLTAFLFFMVLLNLFLMLFNLLPIHPLDGSKLFFALFDAPRYAALRQFVAVRGPQILMFAVLLSLLTPLDLFGFLSGPAYGICRGLTGMSCAGYQQLLFSSI